MAAIPDDCERTATVALPTAASSGFISGEVGISAALDAFSTVYELPLTRFEIRQTDKLDGLPRTQTSRSKGHDYCKHVTSPHGKENGRSIPDDCEKTATVALPTAASPGFLPTTTAPLPHFSTVY